MDRGIYYGDPEWFEENRFSWFPSATFESREWHSSDSRGALSLKLVHKISERVSAPPDDYHPEGVATAVYVADTWNEVSVKKGQVIVKLFMRIPCILVQEGKSYVSKKDLFSRKPPVIEEYPSDPVESFQVELKTLQHLTRHHCASAPSLITSFEQNTHNPWVKAGFLGFIVMEKLPAVPVSDIWKYTPSSEAQVKEQLRIQEAFKVAFVEMTNLGLGMMDRKSRNVMWNSEAGKCYFIDFEISGIATPPATKQTWKDVIAHYPHPCCEFDNWGIIMEDQDQEVWKAINPPNQEDDAQEFLPMMPE